MKANILIIGSVADRNLIRLINNVKKHDINDQVNIDILHTNPPNHNLLKYRLSELTNKVRQIYYVKDQSIKTPLLNSVIRVYNIISTLIQIKNNSYDLVNIHYMSPYYYFAWPLIQKKGRKILISPWGSDIYRVSNIAKVLIKKCYKKTDYVSYGSLKIKEDIESKYRVSDLKLIDLAFGSTMIDLINDSKKTSRYNSKVELGIENYYVIVCGHNASQAHQHKEIIRALTKIKENLPEKTILLFPMTYAKKSDYINNIKSKLQTSDFEHIVFEDFLSEKQLLNIRKAADLFIHIQTTDAFSATLQEYILCGAKIINGSWLKYPELEEFGYPYYITQTIETLSETIIEALNDYKGIEISSQVKKFISERGYNSQSEKWLELYLSSSNIF